MGNNVFLKEYECRNEVGVGGSNQEGTGLLWVLGVEVR
jgi:hypothetical protein